MQQDMTWLRNAYAQLDAMGDAGDESKEYWRARQEIEDYAFARLPAFLDLLDAVSGQAKGVQRGDHASHS